MLHMMVLIYFTRLNVVAHYLPVAG